MTSISRPSTAAPHITLEGPDEASLKAADQALHTIKSGKNGGALIDQLRDLDSSGKRVKIDVASPGSTRPNRTIALRDPEAALTEANNKKGVADASKSMFGMLKGKGASSVVEWNPNSSLKLNQEGKPTGVEESADKAYLSLGHELIHSYRIGKGTYTGGGSQGGFVPGTKQANEEERAVGIGKWSKKEISENGIRAEHGEPPRNAYARVRSDSEDEFDQTKTIRPAD